MFEDVHINDGLHLTRYKYSYAHDLVDAMKDVAIYNNTLKVPYPYFMSDASEYIQFVRSFEQKHQLQKEWAILLHHKMIGAIGLHYNNGIDAHVSEIGYWINKEYRGNGYMTAVLKTFSRHVFTTTNLQKLKATIFEFNHASAKALAKAGFKVEGMHPNEYRKDGKLLNAISYGLCK